MQPLREPGTRYGLLGIGFEKCTIQLHATQHSVLFINCQWVVVWAEMIAPTALPRQEDDENEPDNENSDGDGPDRVDQDQSSGDSGARAQVGE